MSTKKTPPPVVGRLDPDASPKRRGDAVLLPRAANRHFAPAEARAFAAELVRLATEIERDAAAGARAAVAEGRAAIERAQAIERAEAAERARERGDVPAPFLTPRNA